MGRSRVCRTGSLPLPSSGRIMEHGRGWEQSMETLWRMADFKGFHGISSGMLRFFWDLVGFPMGFFWDGIITNKHRLRGVGDMRGATSQISEQTGNGRRIIGLEWNRENAWENTACVCVCDWKAISSLGIS